MKRIRVLFVLSLVFTAESCVESIMPHLNESDAKTLLVVEGMITNETGPFRVRLTTTVPVNVSESPHPVTDAEVKIIDDKGDTYLLTGSSTGWYETDKKDLQGIPGNTYTLQITTGDGTYYESAPQLMQDVPEIDSVYFENVSHTTLANGLVQNENWLNILLDTHDPAQKLKYWQFTFEETWEVEMLTDKVPVEHAPPGEESNITYEKINIDPEKKVCWVTEPSNSILIANTENSPDDRIRNFRVTSLGPGEDKLHILYSILVKQYALDPDLYTFWKQLSESNENTGSVYDKIPSQVYGNISCINADSRALGYFSASCVKSKRIFIYNTEHQVKTVSAYQTCTYYDYPQLPWIPKSYFGTEVSNGKPVYCSADFCADCRTYGTNVKPEFWP